MKALIERDWEMIHLTGRMQCGHCWEVKDVPFDFHPRVGSARFAKGDGLERYNALCRECWSANARQWARDHPQRMRDRKHREQLNRYGITEEDWDEMLEAQGGVCAICGNEELKAHGRTGTQFRLSVDHDHQTGKVRGLLCIRCNRSLGLLGDDVEILRRAIVYLSTT